MAKLDNSIVSAETIREIMVLIMNQMKGDILRTN